jgi:hypothetical protein
VNYIPHRKDIKDVVVILAGSRTGSTFLFDQLSSTERFHCPQGEETPYYRMAGIGEINGIQDSDAIYTIPDTGQLEMAAGLLLADSGIPSRKLSDKTFFIQSLKQRISFQWPDISSKLCRDGDLYDWIHSKIDYLPTDYSRWQEFYLEVLSFCAKKQFSREDALLTPITQASPSHPIIEETPFIYPKPRISIQREQLDQYPLLLKTSTNVYRTGFLRSLFPNARFRWVILKRNPAATISALFDGWKSGGFQSHFLPEETPLKIKDYSETNPFGERFWKFDLPPGWGNYRSSDLLNVCSFQWLSAHSEILKFLEKNEDKIYMASYESFLESDVQFELNNILQFALNRKLDNFSFHTGRYSAQVSKPQAMKWKKRETEISSSIRNFGDGDLIQIAKRFDYDFNRIEKWI